MTQRTVRYNQAPDGSIWFRSVEGREVKKLEEVKNPYQRKIYKIFNTRIIAYPVKIGKILKSPKAAIFLSQLLYWHNLGVKPGWIYKKAEEFYDETGLSRKAQNTAIRILKDKGILETKLEGVPPIRHFKVDLDAILKL